MTGPNFPQQPGPYGPPPPGRQPPPPYGQPPYGPQSPPYGQQLPPYGQQPPPYGQPSTPPHGQPPYGQQPPPPPPYGQEPPPPRYGQEPPPPPYGQDPPPEYPPAPAGRPAKSGGKKKLISILVGIAVVAVGAAAYTYLTRNEPDNAAAGDCIKVNRAAETNADVEKIDCTNPEAVYKIGKKLDSSTATCPEGNYVEYTETGGRSLKLCLMLNAKEGECFVEEGNQDKRSDCASANYKVAKVITGTAKAEDCGEEDAANALVYSEPATTICRVAAA